MTTKPRQIADILNILSDSDWSDAVPNDRNDDLWEYLRTDCGFSRPELSLLKNRQFPTITELGKQSSVVLVLVIILTLFCCPFLSVVDTTATPKKDAVYVFGVCKCGPNDTHQFDLVGTSFAVSQQHLLSAYHCLFDEDCGNNAADLAAALDGVSCYVGRYARRLDISPELDETFSFSLHERRKVTPVAGSYDEDWLLMLCVEELPLYFAICPAEELPDIDTNSVATRVLHCPVAKYRVDLKMSTLRAHIVHTSIAEMYENYMETPIGLVTGSSGGVYVDSLGRAVAIHLESTDEIASRSTSGDSAAAVDAVATAPVDVKTRGVHFEGELNAQRVVLTRLEKSVARNKKYTKLLAKKHTSFGRGLIISRTEALVAALKTK